MATKTGQRIGILVITAVMIIGTLGSFAVMMLSYDNQASETKKAQQEQNKMQEAFKEYQKKTEAQASELSAKYLDEFKKYESMVGKFDSNVTSLKTEDISMGDGDVITKETKYSAYYIGFRPDGTIFDTSLKDGKLSSPLPGGNMIQGWNEGVLGMKIGGVRVLTIPSDMAYGEKGSGDKIPPNTPLKFIVKTIPYVEQIQMPQFGTGYGG